MLASGYLKAVKKEKLIKPDPAIYKCLMERYGLVAEECIFVDDREENVEAATEVAEETVEEAVAEEAAE